MNITRFSFKELVKIMLFINKSIINHFCQDINYPELFFFTLNIWEEILQVTIATVLCSYPLLLAEDIEE